MRKTICGFDDLGSLSGAQRLVFYGPTLMVDIGFDPTYVKGKGAPLLGAKGVGALVDTGATQSCIDSALAMQLNLPVINRQMVSGVHGKGEVNVHLAHIYVPSLHHVITGAFAGVNLAAGGQPHMALMGRTFLRGFRMSYDGLTGKVEITDDFT